MREKSDVIQVTCCEVTGLREKTLYLPDGENGTKALAKRRHDLMAAMRTLRFTAEALGEGYKFDDDAASAKAAAVARAVKVVEKEAVVLLKVLDENEDGLQLD